MNSTERYENGYGVPCDECGADPGSRETFASKLANDNRNLVIGCCVFLASLGFALWSIFGPLPHWMEHIR